MIAAVSVLAAAVLAFPAWRAFASVHRASMLRTGRRVSP